MRAPHERQATAENRCDRGVRSGPAPAHAHKLLAAGTAEDRRAHPRRRSLRERRAQRASGSSGPHAGPGERPSDERHAVSRWPCACGPLLHESPALSSSSSSLRDMRRSSAPASRLQRLAARSRVSRHAHARTACRCARACHDRSALPGLRCAQAKQLSSHRQKSLTWRLKASCSFSAGVRPSEHRGGGLAALRTDDRSNSTRDLEERARRVPLRAAPALQAHQRGDFWKQQRQALLRQASAPPSGA